MKTKLHVCITILFLSVQLTFSQWTQVGTDINGEAPDDNSGYSVSLSSDGTIVAIGARLNDGDDNDSGHVRVYQFNGVTWNQLGNDINGEATDDWFSESISLSSDGTIVAIGAPRNDNDGLDSGYARIYQFDGANWDQIGNDINGEAIEDWFGFAVSLSSDGSRVAIGGRHNDGNGLDSGHARIYQFNGINWIQVGVDIEGEAVDDNFGMKLDLSGDGDRVAIGTIYNDGNGNNSGHVRIYEDNGLEWVQLGMDIDGEAANDTSGVSISLNNDGSRVAIGANGYDGIGVNSGYVRIFQYDGANWNQLGGNLDGEAAGDRFGESVSLNSDGNKVAVGGTHNDSNGNESGHVRIYEYNNGSDIWEQLGDAINGEAAEDYSGYSVSLSNDGSRVAIGAHWNDGNGNASGHARIFADPDLDNSSVSVGIGSGGNTTTGTNNTFLGDYSGFSTTEGNNNTFMGFRSGYTNQTGSGNVFLGHRAGYNETSSDKLYIDNSDTDSPLIWGDFVADSLRINGILSINSIPNNDTLTRVLVSDNDGNVNWRDVTTVGGIDNLGNHQVLQDLLPDADNSYDLGGNGTAFSNIYFDNSLFINDTEFLHTRDNNIAIGNAALSAVAGGSQNVAVGENALATNTTGSNNTAIGNGADVSDVSFTNATAIGNGALTLSSNRVTIGNSSVTRIGGNTNWSNFSDGRFKTNVKEDVPGLEFIGKLRPVSYDIDQARLQTFLGEERTTSQPARKAIGFIAQEVDNIVDENNYAFTGVEKPKNDKDHYGLKYAEFVVPLVKGMQEQQVLIESLQELVDTQQQKIEALEDMIYGTGSPTGSTQTKSTDIGLEGFALHQNMPNPFHQTTTINAVVPETVQQAKIMIYNLNGLELESYPLNERGNVSLSISGGQFPSGMYLYALLADGRIIDTKKMILTR